MIPVFLIVLGDYRGPLALENGVMSTDTAFTLEYCGSEPPATVTAQPATLLIDHPWRDFHWIVVRRLPEPRWFLLRTAVGQTLAVYESDFTTEVQ